MSEQPKKNGSTYLVEVKLRHDYSDAEGEAALGLLRSLGVNTAKEVRASRLYEFSGGVNSAQVQQAARELLCDPVTQEFRMLSGAATPVLNGMNHWRIEVWLKPSVTDPVGETVRAALNEIGLPAQLVRVGTAYHVNGKCGRNQLEKAVARSLANPVIHRFSVTEAPL